MSTERCSLILIVLLLGIRHGFEPDHLAVIDGMTRCTNSKLSRYIGCLFSIGHGIVVILITVFIGFEAKKWNIPVWFDKLGQWVSILFLIFFGIYSLYTASKANRSDKIKFLGAKSFLFNKIVKIDANTSFLVPVLIGMLFSLSFDTLSLTTAFSLTGYELGGAFFPILLGTIFMFGMMMTDGLNGYLVAYILNHVDKRSQFVSRLLGYVIGGFSLIIGGSYLISYFRVL